tara:strand:+ start:2662 stop:2964 length:303 start_codon:yes stop_codon:yes gene_type:complete
MTHNEAMQLARADYRRSVLDGMGLFMIAEAWGIEPWAKTQYGGHGVLTEGYVLDQMARQIMEMDIGSDTLAAEVLYLPGVSRANDGNLGDIGKRQAGMRQ